MNALGSNIRELRQSRGWSQQELADILGVTRVAITRIELGQSMPNWDFVCRVADVFGVSTDELRKILRKVPVPS